MTVNALYPTVAPSLDLNFVRSGVLDSRVTFTRASTGTYFNSLGTLTTALTNVPRLDYNPSTLAAQGLLIEEARTNSIRNNTMVGAAAGTPGTLPTNWAVSGLGTLTQQIVGTGTSNGITYIDFRFSGTTSTTQVGIRLEPVNGAAGTNGQTFTFSSWVARVAGSTSNISDISANANIYDSGSAYLTTLVLTGYPITVPTTLSRVSGTSTIASATAAFIQPQIYLIFASGVAIDITLRIGLPQLEQGAFATSVIPTTTVAVTRSADVASVNTLTPWYNATAGTMYTEFAVTQPVSGGNQFLARFSDNSFNNSIADNVNTSGFAALATASGGVFDGNATTVAAVSANTITKFAGAYAANDLAASLNGGTVATDTSVIIPSGLTRLDLGSDHTGTNRVKAGYIRRITYFPVRLSNANLQAITT